MGVVEELRAELDGIAVFDHHAHAISDGSGIARDFPWMLTEASSPDAIAAMRDHPAYVRAIRDLSGFLEVKESEQAILEERERAGFEAYARRLLVACRFAEMLVDDGLPMPGAIALGRQADLAAAPMRRVLRIERTVEEAAEGWPAFEVARERFRADVTAAVDGGAAGLKTIAAYRCGFSLPDPDRDDASAAYERWRSNGSTRLVEPALVSFFLDEALEATGERLPLQVHTGLGDTDLVMHAADPWLLRPLFERRPRVTFVLLHCHPFIRQASYLASVYPQVYFDLSLTMTFAPHRGAEMLLEAFELAPVTKVLFATDASWSPEPFYLATRWWREELARALGQLCADGSVDEGTAVRWGANVLAGNARRIYG
jgi:hypothetical protein